MVGEPLLVLVGPTGVGKTAVAVRMAVSLPIEAVSADSRQVYRRMDIGTGKPSPEERRRLHHHLIDVVDPGERYDAARFRREALEAIADIRARGRLPMVVGGTGLYVRALVKGLAPAPPRDPDLRATLEAERARLGGAALHARLEALDAPAAARLHPRDHVRIVRAIEVRLLRAPGAPGAGAVAAGNWSSRSPFRLLMVGLAQDRARLNERLTARVQAMVARGMMEEVRALLQAGHAGTAPGMATIGYRQLAAAARGAIPIAEAIRLTIRDTTRYAKRQMTWFARDPETRWLDVDAGGGLEGVAQQIATWVREEGLVA
ncbi:MAG TPA: tRNA (adenosine(37)-N6)-dimethylallyltransferase MiaA [Candidatus Binatia bacterium]|nr:tRNA (adenosine(37)-N6)-dimethylallyltransferase MiaA [Candidatus Binatia bacterium]